MSISALELAEVLLVNECGLVEGDARIIQPHPHFRMSLAMEQRDGERSRAMRTRSMPCLQIPARHSKRPLADTEMDGTQSEDDAEQSRRGTSSSASGPHAR